ncbi:MAG: hypothetical protein IJV40_09175 [Oscillospiraceae bacterium]|nr:hypothetical protein [Oscillospiraceae bacterium]
MSEAAETVKIQQRVLRGGGNDMRYLRAIILSVLSASFLCGCWRPGVPDMKTGEEGEKNTPVESFNEYSEYAVAVAELIREFGWDRKQQPENNTERIEDDFFRSGRVLVTTEGKLEQTMGAVRILHFGDEYVLQFRTDKEAKSFYETACASGSYIDVSPDLLLGPDSGIQP